MKKLSFRKAERVATLRRNEFMRPFEVATFYNDGLADNEFQADGKLIRGIGQPGTGQRAC